MWENLCASVFMCVSCIFSLVLVCFVCLFECFWYCSIFYFICLLILSYFILDVCILMRERKGVDLGGRRSWDELGGVGEGKTIIGIYCNKKPFSILKKKNKTKKFSLHLSPVNSACYNKSAGC